MKRCAVCVLVMIVSLLSVSCNREQQRILDRLLKTETGEYSGEEIDRERVEELEKHVRRYADEAEQLVKETGKLGIYYKMLALDYLDQEMYGPAEEYFLRALEVYPNNHVLHYYTGLAQAQLSGAQPGAAERTVKLEEAAFHHERAIELKPDYYDALYALSVLYIFELDKPLSAEEYVMRALDVRSNNINSLFLLARIRVIQGRFEEAVEIYDLITDETGDSEILERARNNRDRLLGGGLNE